MITYYMCESHAAEVPVDPFCDFMSALGAYSALGWFRLPRTTPCLHCLQKDMCRALRIGKQLGPESDKTLASAHARYTVDGASKPHRFRGAHSR